MKKTRFTEEQMVKILREADETPVAEAAKKHGISDQTIYGRRQRFGQLEPADVKRLRQLKTTGYPTTHDGPAMTTACESGSLNLN